MKSLKLKINIKKSAKEIFDFALDPKNTPKWVDSIVVEETNEWPVKIGTIYKNCGNNSVWSEYKVIKYIKGKVFEFLKSDNNYHVRYTLTPKNNGLTQLEYYEWVKHGELEDPFTMEFLEKFKSVIESQ